MQQKSPAYEFGPFRLDTLERQLFRSGQPVSLTPKAYETLLLLVESSGRLLTKDQLMRAIWPDTFVEEANLAHNISMLRKALGETVDEQQYVQTVPRRGYRFIAEVTQPEEEDGEVKPQAAPLQALEDDKPVQQKNAAAGLAVFPRRSFRLTALAAGVLLVVGITVVYRSVWWPDPPTNLRTLAVLPFKPLASTDRDESLELGMADTLIRRLSGSGKITVRPFNAVRKYSRLDQDPVAAGEELKVDAVLDGTMQRAGDRMRVTVRLVSVTDARQLWAGSFDEKFTDIFAMQDAVSQRVAEALALRLIGKDAERLTKHFTEDAEAYRLYLKGEYLSNKFTPEGSNTAIEYFSQAIARDPSYATAYASLAKSYGIMGINGWLPPKEAFPKAKAAATKALQLDDQLAEGHAASGTTEMFYEWNWSAAERELQRAIDLNPDYSDPHRLYSYLLTATGRFDESIAQTELNLRLDPLSPVSYADVVRAYYFASRYDEAVEANRKANEMDPNFAIAHLVAGAAYEQKGMYDEALAELRKANNFPGGFSEAMGAMGHAYAVSGKRSEALKLLEELREMSKRRYVSPLDFALLYTGLGDKERALDNLERAAEERVGWLINLKVDPRFASLRTEARYTDLIRRLRLAP
ncbi:MAG: winged helix-turn-helix domain-containing protein [Pyrinomonadaceae bacterium]|nr:winged helix-turn-helix domain-containing protein [Pyrinomonadaceae bacterium]